MKINALLDVNVVAHETDDEVAVLLELEAPAATTDETRRPASLQIVLDRSGSMAGPRLEGAKKAITDLVRRLEPTDNFGLVVFDDSAEVVAAAGPLADKEAVIARIDAVVSGGMTDLSSGYLRGLRELRRVSTGSTNGGAIGGTLLVISDGHVNGGIQDADEFAALTAKAYGDGIVTSTLGYGDGYDEALLAALARAGSGNHVFANTPDAAGAAIAGEVDGLLSKVVQALSCTIHFEPTVEMLRLYNDLPAQQIGDGQVMVELGDLYSEETRKVLLKLHIPAMADIGTATVATLELGYVELPAMVEQTVTLPININVVPGDEAAARVPNPTVRSEVLFQEAQETKKRASDAYRDGDFEGGQRLLAETRDKLRTALDTAPDRLADDVRAELSDVDGMHETAGDHGPAYMAKVSLASYDAMTRKRGRRRDDGGDRDR